jgi:hypothetical protein
MKDLTSVEVNMVSGGNPLALIGLAVGIIYSGDKLQEFAAGFIAGFLDNPKNP